MKYITKHFTSKYLKSVLKTIFCLCLVHLCWESSQAQNSMVSEGFGGRLWYTPYNYSAGSYAAYTICGEERQMLSWGHNSHHELGDGTAIGKTIPVEVLGMDSTFYFSSGYVGGAIKLDRSGWVWGSSAWAFKPIKVIEAVKFVDGGAYNCAFVKYDGTVWSVGSNQFGEFGDSTSFANMDSIPKQMKNITRY